LAPQPTDVNRGNDVLGQIFGSRDVSRSVARHASTQSGLDPALLKKMLPVLAMLVSGYMARSGGSAGAAQAGVGVGGGTGHRKRGREALPLRSDLPWAAWGANRPDGVRTAPPLTDAGSYRRGR
jgi:hypothetical protein